MVIPKRTVKMNLVLFRYVVLVLLDESDSNAYLGESHIDLENFQVEIGFEGSFELSDMVIGVQNAIQIFGKTDFANDEIIE